MKSRVIKGIILTICLIFVMSIVGCGCAGKEVTIRSDGFFQYIIVDEYDRVPTKDNEEVIAIVGFTESGYEQEVLEIPREIDGKTVRYIGYRDEGFWHYNSHHVFSENLRKAYIHDNIEKVKYFEGPEVNVMICSKNDDLFSNYSLFKGTYLYKSMIKTTNSNTIFPANIVFMNNYSNEVNEGYYRLDNIESGEKIPVVPNPEREGYSFTGWYEESECINKWNFDNTKEIAEDEEFRLYAGWQAK